MSFIGSINAETRKWLGNNGPAFDGRQISSTSMAEPAQREKDDATEPVDDELESSRMPFLAHLRELRDRVRNAAIAFMLAAFGCFYFSDQIFDWLKEPLFSVWKAKKLGTEPHLVFVSLTEPFWVNMSIALWAGIFAASPFIFYQLWKFVAPGLYKRERRITVAFAVFSAIFFTAGAVFCRYFVIESLANFLLDYSDAETAPMLAMGMYLDLIRDLMLAIPIPLQQIATGSRSGVVPENKCRPGFL